MGGSAGKSILMPWHSPPLVALSVAVDVEAAEATATAACDPDLLRRYAVPYRLGSVEQTESAVTALLPAAERKVPSAGAGERGEGESDARTTLASAAGQPTPHGQ